MFQSYWTERLSFLDVHYHVNPDSYLRRYNALGAGKKYKNLGGGVVLKSHLGSSVTSASIAQEEGYPVFGSIVLNDIAGGIDIKLVQQSLCQYNFIHSGRLIVHLPTITPHKHQSVLVRHLANEKISRYALKPISVTDENGRLISAVCSLLEFAQSEDIVISTGHANRREVELLIETSDKLGGIKLMLNQPANPITGMSASDLLALGKHEWLFIEQTSLTVLLGYQSLEDLFEVLTYGHQVVFSSDLGQTTQIDPEQWRSQSQQQFKDIKLKKERIKELTLLNPLNMLAPKNPASR